MGHLVHLVNSCGFSCPCSLWLFLCPRRGDLSPAHSLGVVILNCSVTLVYDVQRNNICYNQPIDQLTQRGKNDNLLDVQTLQGHRSKGRLMCLNACDMFFPAMLAGLIKYILAVLHLGQEESRSLSQ